MSYFDELVPESIVDFKYLKPSEENLKEFKKWLENGRFTLKDIEHTEMYTSWDIREDRLEGQDLWYYLQLFYWAMAYGITLCVQRTMLISISCSKIIAVNRQH